MQKNKQTVAIIGGGASGFFCAIQLATQRPDVQILILEKQNKVLQKVKVSGGGRCNVTHHCHTLSELLTAYPRGKNVLKKAFRLFGPEETMQWFRSHGVPLKIESDGRVFPESNSSQSIIDCFLNEASERGIEVRLQTDVTRVHPEGGRFKLEVKNGNPIVADQVVLAAGGWNRSEAYQWLQALGHDISEPLPSLFTMNIPDKDLHQRMGSVAPHAMVRIESSSLQEQGPVLVTHWGLSGPAILRLSAWGARELALRQYDFNIQVNWCGMKENELRLKWNSIRDQQGSGTLSGRNPFDIPNRIWEYLLCKAGIEGETRWSELNSKWQNRLIHVLTGQSLEVKGKTTFKEEFVTCGGVSLQSVHPESLESKVVPGLYFCGEILDVDGITGGYNFQHAWTSGFIVAMALAKQSAK
ncbi:MAG TPA: NAD(P)/FAD-dependent oxidoreductase [Chitinophagaceae bacterium]|nr:NAD(P)/FAD-dependent oxidoreductase [Chitinophagaceae bacterium]